MFLTAYNLPHYLISKGIVTAQSVVAGDFVLAEVGRRNRNFKVFRREHAGVFVKQVKTTDAEAIATLRREAIFYRAVESNPSCAAIRGIIPRHLNYDERRHVLTVNLVEDAESVAERQLREGPCREDTANQLGQALGQIHALSSTVVGDARLRPLFTYQMPWPLQLDQIGYGFLEKMGSVGPALSAAIRQMPALQAMLAALRSRWQYDSLIHGDMKWDNCMIRNKPGELPQLTIVDWELTDIGDGAWDVAGIFKEYVMALVLNAYGNETAAVQNVPPPPAINFEQLRRSIGKFWQAYAGARQLWDGSSYMDRAIRLVGARMVAAVLEYLFASPQLGTLGAKMLQTSIKILEAPEIVASQLFSASARPI